MSDRELQKIVSTCAEIIVVQEHQEMEEETRKAIDEMGGCSTCGDLSGYNCTCDDEDDFYYEFDDDFFSEEDVVKTRKSC